MPHSAGRSFPVSHLKISRDANTAVIYLSLLRCQFREGLPRCQIPWAIPFTMPIPRIYFYRDANSANLFLSRCQIPRKDAHDANSVSDSIILGPGCLAMPHSVSTLVPINK